MTTYTSSLPSELLEELDAASKQLSVPKNKIIEKALRIYLIQLKRLEYKKSFKRASKNANEEISIAAEGMAEYMKQLEDE